MVIYLLSATSHQLRPLVLRSLLQDNLTSPDSGVRQMSLHSMVMLLPALGTQVKKIHPECQVIILFQV